jgi:hypothetical protein
VAISRKHVVRLMRLEGLRAQVRKRYRCTTMNDHDQPSRPICSTGASWRSGPASAGWVTSPEILTRQGKLYLRASSTWR